MPKKQYSWKHGPDEIQDHSVAKHKVLRSYLARYFTTLVSSPHQDKLSLTLVDGFAGGGQYCRASTGELVWGSPFICLEAAREAAVYLNQGRHKPLTLDIGYFFIEKDRDAYLHLEKLLKEQQYGSRLGRDIFLRHSKFQDEAQNVIDYIRKKNPRNGRSIFVLDQYGYKEVPGHLIKTIFTSLPRAEVILTFAVDSLLNYASDSKLTKELLDEIGIPDILGNRSFEEIKRSDRDWRLFVQSGLYHGLVSRCGAQHYTPFFIRNSGGHGDYWLIHLSQHSKARDVMTEVHWQNQNHFIHYGGAGINMFQMVGYDPDMDSDLRGQNRLGFEFDDIARARSIEKLKEQIPRLVYANDEGLTFGELFVSTCNTSPASADIYRVAIEQLITEKSIAVYGEDGAVRRVGSTIKTSDQIVAPEQRSLLFT